MVIQKEVTEERRHKKSVKQVDEFILNVQRTASNEKYQEKNTTPRHTIKKPQDFRDEILTI